MEAHRIPGGRFRALGAAVQHFHDYMWCFTVGIAKAAKYPCAYRANLNAWGILASLAGERALLLPH